MNTKHSPDGPILADPTDISTNIPLERIEEISTYLNAPENKVKIQFPSPETQYAYVNFSKFNPTAQVPRGGPVAVLPYATDMSISKIEYRNKAGNWVSVDEHFATKPIDAMIVVKAGEIVSERYRKMKSSDKHLWNSISKVTRSTCMALNEHEGIVDVDAPVSSYLTELQGSVWDTVRVVEAMDMATGLNGTEHDEPEPNSRTDPDQIWFRWAATRTVWMLPDVRKRNESWVDVFRSMERHSPPYQKFEYNSINTFVMNRINERIAGKPLYTQFSERVWSKLGMEHDTLYTVSPSGNTLGFFGINATLRDTARFGIAFTPSCKKIAEEQILPNDVMAKIQDRTHLDMYDKGWIGKKNSVTFWDDAGDISNRYQWDAVLSDGDMFKAGVGGQGVYTSPETDTVVAFFSTGDGENREEGMARAIVRQLAGNPLPR